MSNFDTIPASANTDSAESSDDSLLHSHALALIFATYRVTLSVLLLISQLLSASNYPTAYTPTGFFITAGAYCLFAISFFIFVYRRRKQLSERSLFISFAFDILILISIASSAEHLFSSIGLLVIVALAGANLMIGKRLGLLLAAIAALFPLVGISLFSFRGAIDSSQQLFNVAVLGAAGFFTALFMQYLAARMSNTQQLAKRRQIAIEELRQVNEGIVARMRTGVLVINDSEAVALINSAARELLDIDIIEEDVQPISRPAINQIPAQILALAQASETQTTLCRSPQRGIGLRVTATPFEGYRNSTLVFVEDTAKLTQHAQQLKLASLGRFTASIAHEIRNPLSAIHHAAQLLEEELEQHDASQDLLKIINKNTGRMNEIIENILQLSRRQSGNPQQLELKEWIQNWLKEYQQARSGTADIRFSSDIHSAKVKVDPSQLRQVLNNLLDNALEHGNRDSKAPWASLKLSSHAFSSAISLDICDGGNGVAEADRDKLFEPFFTTSNNGTGLGLYLCKELCESNQVHLSYQHNSGKSHSFRLQFAPPQRGELLE